MSAQVQNDILTMWLPITLVVIVALIGLLRGPLREGIVSAGIALGAFIAQQWAALWAADTYSVFTGITQGWQQFLISSVILMLVVLAAGYGLGTLVDRTVGLRGSDRIWGLFLGILNGVALAGWFMRFAYEGIDGRQASSIFYQNQVSQGFMITAGWFPVAIAVIAAIVALVRPLRRAQVAVAQPAAATNWTPSAPPPAAQGVSPSTAYGSTSYAPTPTGGSAQGGYSPNAPTIAAPVISPAAWQGPSRSESTGPGSPPAGSRPYTPPDYASAISGNAPRSADSTKTSVMPESDAPSTRLMPNSEMPGPPDGTSSATRSFSPVEGQSSTPTSPGTGSPTGTSTSIPAGSTSSSSSWTPSEGPSWLYRGNQSTEGGSQGSSSTSATQEAGTPSSPARTDDSAAPENRDFPRPGGARQATMNESEPANTADAPTRCPNCGAEIQEGASFCTDCGTRLKTS